MKILNFFKKANDKVSTEVNEKAYDHNLLAVYLAYEVAKADGEIDEGELKILKQSIEMSIEGINNIDQILNQIDSYSKNSVSLYDLITEINNTFDKNDKHVLIKSLWVIAYSSNGLDKYEDALIRKITDLLNIKNIDMLRLKDEANPNNL